MRQDFAGLLESLRREPQQGVDLGRGLHKVRMAISSKGKGKSGLSLKKAGIPLYLNKEGSGDNITNHMLWNMMIGAPSLFFQGSMLNLIKNVLEFD